MISFQGRHFPKDLILMAVRWKLAYPPPCVRIVVASTHKVWGQEEQGNDNRDS
jgi:transposase-like protein